MSIIPISEVKKKYSATFSDLRFFFGLISLMEIKENKHEKMSSTDIPDENSSIRLELDLFVRWNEVMTTRQKPRRLVEGPKIW